MKRIEVIINGVAYPCSPTMGAMLRFKQETGREITEMDPKKFYRLMHISMVLRGVGLEA